MDILTSFVMYCIPRSPGGTPVKRCIEREPSDPASIIAQALKKKFSNNFHFSSESDKENDSSSFASDHSTSVSHIDMFLVACFFSKAT